MKEGKGYKLVGLMCKERQRRNSTYSPQIDLATKKMDSLVKGASLLEYLIDVHRVARHH